MKKMIVICYFILFSVNIYAQETQDLFVFAKTGIWLKSSPSLWGERLAIIPYGAELTIEDEEKYGVWTKVMFQDTFPLVGKWLKVDYQGQTGYVFEAYLLDLPTPTSKILKLKDVDKFYAYFEKQLGCKRPKCKSYIDTGFEQIDYKNGVIFQSNEYAATEGEHGMGMYYIGFLFEKHSFQEIVVFAQAFSSDIKEDFGFDSEDNKVSFFEMYIDIEENRLIIDDH